MCDRADPIANRMENHIPIRIRIEPDANDDPVLCLRVRGVDETAGNYINGLPKGYPNAAGNGVEIIEESFQTWSMQAKCGVKGKRETNIRITRSYSPKRKGPGERHPDFALYGPDRLLG